MCCHPEGTLLSCTSASESGVLRKISRVPRGVPQQLETMGDLVSLPVSHSAKPVRSAKISSTEGSKRTSIASDALTFCAASCRAAGADRTEGHALKKRKLRCLQPPRAANSYLMFMCRLLVAVNRANLNLILLAKVASRFLFMNFIPSIEEQNTHFNVMKGQ